MELLLDKCRRVILVFLAAACASSCRCGETPAPPSRADAGAHPTEPAYKVRSFATEAEALAAIVAESNPSIFGFGEYHKQNATSATRSAIARFAESLLPLIAGSISDLVVETWVSTGNCGKTEKQVVREVDEVSERPAETADETVLLLTRAKALGVTPHILRITCDDYAKVLLSDGGLDYFAFLKLVATRLGDRASAIAKARHQAQTSPKAIAIYGGAMHNDITPRSGFEPVSFAQRMRELGVGPYAEIDLLVPEFIAESTVAKDEPWFDLVAKLASRDRASLIERDKGSYIILARAGIANRAPPRPSPE